MAMMLGVDKKELKIKSTGTGEQVKGMRDKNE